MDMIGGGCAFSSAHGSERQRLGNEAVDTEIAVLKIQRADGKLTKRLSQVLFRVDVLQHAFSSCYKMACALRRRRWS